MRTAGGVTGTSASTSSSKARASSCRPSASRCSMTSHGMVPVFKSAKRYSSYKGEIGGAPRESREPRLPRHRAEPAVGHGHHRVLDPGGQGVPVAGHRLPRRHARRLDDRHEPQRRPGQRHARDACATLKPGETPIIHSGQGCHYRWPGMDPHLHRARADPVDEREGLFAGPGRGGVLRPSQAGVLPQEELPGA